MVEKIECIYCKKEIKENDEIILGGKDNYLTLPDNIKSTDVVFLHTECMKKYIEEKNKGENNG